jgi:hypothetical protein
MEIRELCEQRSRILACTCLRQQLKKISFSILRPISRYSGVENVTAKNAKHRELRDENHGLGGTCNDVSIDYNDACSRTEI